MLENYIYLVGVVLCLELNRVGVLIYLELKILHKIN